MPHPFRQWLSQGYQLLRSWWHGAEDSPPLKESSLPLPLSASLKPLTLVVLTEGVAQTLFQEYAAHRQSPRGNEEYGWLLMGLRLEDSVIVSATLPAGASRDAGVAHIRFQAASQSVGSRLIRQQDRRLGIVGMVHTHPGTLRHPSGGDFTGDSQWVKALRGKEGVFGIGTARNSTLRSEETHRDASILHEGPFQFNWYALAEGDARYRSIPASILPGDDHAAPFRKIWPIIDQYAEPLDRLFELFSQIQLKATEGKKLQLRIQTPYQKNVEIELSADQLNSDLELFVLDQVRHLITQR